MTHTRIALLVALALCAPSLARAEAGFAPGEQLDFAIDYLGVRTGQARISVGQPEGNVWPVIAQARTDGLASILDIREHLVSYWDAARHLPRGSDLQAIEVGDRHADSARFDRENGKAHIRIVRKGHKFEDTYDMNPESLDFASALLWLRLQTLADGAHYEIPVFTTHGTFTLVAAVGGRERLETPAGTFDAVKVAVGTRFSGNFASKRDTFVWFSTDQRHVPVRVSADFAVGSVVATLSGYRPGDAVARN